MGSKGYKFNVEIVKNEVVNATDKDGLKAYNKVCTYFVELEEKIKFELLQVKFKSNEDYKATLSKKIEEAGCYYSKDKTERFYYRTPLGTVSGNKLSQVPVGDEDEFFNYYIYKYEVSVLIYGTSEYS